MQTTVLIENALTLIIVGTAFHKTKKRVLLILVLSLLAYMGFNHALLLELQPGVFIGDYQSYYTLVSLFFLACFGLFVVNVTKLNLIMAGLMLSQAIICFAMAINGATIDGLKFPDLKIINTLHLLFNSCVWVAECCIVYFATFTDEE